MTIRISKEEQLRIRAKAKAELQRLEQIDMNELNEFKEKFAICEVVYKTILEEYLLAGKRPPKNMRIQMQQVTAALEKVGYDFDSELLTRLFGSEDHVGRRSVKKLRDLLTHKISQSAIDELNLRKKDIFSDMNAFLDKIRCFDDKVE